MTRRDEKIVFFFPMKIMVDDEGDVNACVSVSVSEVNARYEFMRANVSVDSPPANSILRINGTK